MAEEGDVETVTGESMEYQSHPKEVFTESAINGTSTEHEVEPAEGETKSELDEVQEVVNEQEQQYWKTVLENPGDFTSWTYLLQFVEQENKLLSARKAFDSFFKRYPYCYGYWKKYADMERKNGNLDRAKEVFEQGISAITYSVDLWVHYLNFSSQITKGQADGPQIMRSLFERAISTAGNDYRSDKLWDAFLEWEKSQGQLKKVTDIYDKLLTVPTQKYTQHFQKFKDHINSNPVAAVLSTEELLKLRSEVAASPPGVSTTEASPQVIEAGSKKKASDDKDKKDDDDDDEVAPGTEDLIASGEDESPLIMSENDPETVAIREKVIAARAEAYAKLEDEIRKIWAYEEGIKRPYFHVKPLERVQLKNWKDYLDFEITNGNHDRVAILFERCVIACALYEEFWQKYAGYVEAHSLEKCHDVYERACTIHLPKKPNIHLSWAAFEEEQGNNNLAAKILEDLDAGVPDLALVKLRRINLERRRGNLDKVSTIYEEAIEGTEDTSVKSFYAVRYARFLSKVAGNEEQAYIVLKDCIEKDKDNKRLYLQLLDLALNQRPVSEERVEEVFDLIKNTNLDTDIKQEFSQRRLEFLEDFSSSITKLMKANEAHSKLYKTKSSNLNGITSGKKRPSESSSDNKAKALKADDGVSDTTLAYQTTTPSVTEAYDSTYSTAYSAAAAAYSYAATPVHNQWAAAGYAATQPAAYAATQPAAYAATQPAAYNYSQWYYGQQVPTTPSM